MEAIVGSTRTAIARHACEARGIRGASWCIGVAANIGTGMDRSGGSLRPLALCPPEVTAGSSPVQETPMCRARAWRNAGGNGLSPRLSARWLRHARAWAGRIGASHPPFVLALSPCCASDSGRRRPKPRRGERSILRRLGSREPLVASRETLVSPFLRSIPHVRSFL